MSGIVSFPKTAEAEERRRQVEQKKSDEAARAQLETARLEEKRQSLERARKACSCRKRMTTPSERRIVALNLWNILERLETGPRKIPKSTVLIEAGKAREGDSTKHLERYALKPGLSEKDESKKASRLVQSIRVYIDLARKAAHLEGSPEDDAEIDVLQGSRYLSGLTEMGDEEPDSRSAAVIAEGLRRMAERLDSRHNLKRYFRLCHKSRLMPVNESASETTLASGENGDISDLRAPASLTKDNIKSISRCPRVYIGSTLVKEMVSTDAEAEATVGNEHFTIEVKIPVRPMDTYDIYICLTPFGVAGTITPVLFVEKIVRFKPVSDFDLEFPSCVEEDSAEDNVADDESYFGPIFYTVKKYCTIGETRNSISGSVASTIFFHSGIFVEPDSHIVPDAANIENVIKNLESYGSFDNIIVKAIPAESTHRPSLFAEYARIEPATYDQLKQYLCRPLFFRYHDDLGTRCPIDWTDERRNSKCYYDSSRNSNATSPPTVATEATLLARLERWMRGDLKFDAARATISHSSLEDELDARTSVLVKALDDALAEADRKLQLVLVPPEDRRDVKAAPVADTHEDAPHTPEPTDSQIPIEEEPGHP